MFGWFDKNPTKNLPVKRVEKLSVDLERQSFNGISGSNCDVSALSSLGKATGYNKYPNGHNFSWRESGFKLCITDRRLDSFEFYLIPTAGSEFSACQLEIQLGVRKLLLQPSTTANQIIQFLGDPNDAVDFEDETFDVQWQGTNWVLSCEFDKSTGLEIVGVDFPDENGE